jgi:hypothetical protein
MLLFYIFIVVIILMHYLVSVIWGRSVVFSGAAISSTNKTDLHHITEILLKVALNTITLSYPNVYRQLKQLAIKYIMGELHTLYLHT